MEGLINRADGDTELPDSARDLRAIAQQPSRLAQQRVVIVDRDPEALQPLRNKLVQVGFEVCFIGRPEEAVAAIERKQPHLVMLDWDLPGVFTMEVVRQVRHWVGLEGPRLIALSTFAGEERVVSGLELGVDDYVIKPFSLPELVARVRAVLRARKGTVEDADYVEFGELRMDACDERITIRDRRVSLRSMEFRLLRFLLRHPNRAFKRETLLNSVWGHDCDTDLRAVDVTVQRIRKALEPHGYHGYLQTIRGVGYRLSMCVAGTARG